MPRARFESIAVPVPAGVAQATVVLTDDERFGVPVVLVCPEYTPDQAREWIRDGEIPELERAEHVSFVDIESGHWPMITRQGELARILHDIAGVGAPDRIARGQARPVRRPGG